MADQPNYESINDLDAIYTTAMDSITNFFRFEKRNPEAYKFGEEYYMRVAEVMKRRIDHEIKHLNSPYLD